jgi:hypothetical protein
MGLHLRFLRIEPVHPRDRTRSLVTLYGTSRWILQEKPDGYSMATSRLTLKVVRNAGVVSSESVGIALTYAALNGLKVCAADIRNAYLQAPSSNKDNTYAALSLE